MHQLFDEMFECSAVQCGLSMVAALIKVRNPCAASPAANRNWAHQPTFKEKKFKTIVYTKGIKFMESFEKYAAVWWVVLQSVGWGRWGLRGPAWRHASSRADPPPRHSYQKLACSAWRLERIPKSSDALQCDEQPTANPWIDWCKGSNAVAWQVLAHVIEQKPSQTLQKLAKQGWLYIVMQNILNIFELNWNNWISFDI